ncbi:hypothetical protein N836_26750 [Leptolyngbya sp. Heron Island J]|nr:hypothetical protein N836_26750 [Leptolyngbya sp. Heron Island J]
MPSWRSVTTFYKSLKNSYDSTSTVIAICFFNVLVDLIKLF